MAGLESSRRVDLVLRNNGTGEVRSVVTSFSNDEADDGNCLFYYLEGNLECDCNREAQFVGGGDFDCGSSRFSVLRLSRGGRVLYDNPWGDRERDLTSAPG